MAMKLPRPPQNDDELWWLFKAMIGVELPRHAHGRSSRPVAAELGVVFWQMRHRGRSALGAAAASAILTQTKIKQIASRPPRP